MRQNNAALVVEDGRLKAVRVSGAMLFGALGVRVKACLFSGFRRDVTRYELAVARVRHLFIYHVCFVFGHAHPFLKK